MTCAEMFFADLDEIIDGEIDCVGCTEKDCPNDKRNDNNE